MSEIVKASFDTETVEGQMKAFNAQSGASVSLKHLENGAIIECEGAMIYKDIIDTYGTEQEGYISVLFANDGSTYAGVSETVYKATSKLIDFIHKTGLESIKVRVVKQTSSKGNEFLNLQIVPE